MSTLFRRFLLPFIAILVAATAIFPSVASAAVVEPAVPADHPELFYRWQTARLYVAYFDRVPDTDGWTYWNTQHVVGGQRLEGISDYFTQSAEFTATYGNLSDAEFVNLVYINVMGRYADAAGEHYWQDRLAEGTTRGEMMVQFSESPEFIVTAGPVLTGAAQWSLSSNVQHAYAHAIWGTPGFTQPTTPAPPAPIPTPTPAPIPVPTVYKNCTEVRNAGAAPIYRGESGYSSKLDRDGDGIACE